MTDIAIRVENLSKQYRIGGPQARYKTIRESLTEAVGAPFRRLSSVVRGQSSAVSNETIWALKDVSFEVQRGEVVGIIGRNGAGKTTLLKILSRITEPTEGHAEIHGRVGSLLEVGTGFHPELTGRENIYLNGAILGMKRAEIDRKFDEIVAFAEIEKFMDTPVKHYSSGMYVRLAFAVAAHLEPEILLVDEVLAVGDAAFQKKCLGKMGDVAKEGRTVLFVSHNMQAVAALCQRAILLEEGKIVANGEVSDVVGRYLAQVAGPLDSVDAVREYSEDLAKAAQITRVRVLNKDGHPSLQHYLLDSITIVVDFVLRQDFPNLIIGCQIRTTQDLLVLGTSDPDWANFTTGRNEDMHPKQAGCYQASFVLPVPLLNAGTYELVFILNVPMVDIPDMVRGVFIEVIDTDTFASCLFKHSRTGLLAIPLEWRLDGPA